MLTLSVLDFAVLADLVKLRLERLVTYGDNRKSIVMPTPMTACNVLLTEAELADLNHLLQLADTEMKAAALIRLFGPGNPDTQPDAGMMG